MRRRSVHTADLDIRNAMTAIVWHLFNMMGIVDRDVFKTELATLDQIVNDRDGTITRNLRVSRVCGKQLLLHACSGKRIPEKKWCKNPCLRSIQRLGIFLSGSLVHRSYTQWCGGSALRTIS